nr:MAG TPA: DNA POLYMERASE [Caudoviricetes sp.]
MEIQITDKFKDVQRYLQGHTGAVICDIETTSLAVGKGEILCMAFAAYNSNDVLVWWPRTAKAISRLKLNKGVFHNAHFDMKWLRHYGAQVRCVWDTMLMAHLLDENRKIGLKELGQRLLGYDDWALDEISDLKAASRDKVSEYVAKDVHVTRELMRWQRAAIKRNTKPGFRPYWVMKHILIPAIEPLTQMEINRMPVRLGELEKVQEEVEAKLAAIDQELDSLIPPPEMWPEFLKKTTPKWGSTNWTRWWLYDYMGATVVNRGKPSKHWPEGSPSLSQATLGKIDNRGAKLLSERSTLYKLMTGFIVPLRERGETGRVATSFKLTGTVTGRLSSASPSSDDPGINSQQIPRNKQIRNLFGQKGMAWIEADYSQLELRVAAALAHEPTMLQLFRDGTDIHAYMAEQLVGTKDFTKEQRSLAKGVNFGFLYGMHAKHFANYLQESYGVVITQKDAEKFRDNYFKTFSELQPWYRRQRDFCLKHGGVPNAFGRFRNLPKVYDEDYWVQENAFRQAINSPVQSTGSDFMLISLSRLAGDLRLKRLGAKLITTVHDSVCITAPYKNARKVAKIVKETMERADDGLRQDFFIKADVEISRYWGGETLATY